MLELGIVLVGEILARASSLIESLLGDLFTNEMSVRLMEHAATLDLAQFEDPEFYDHLERARRQTVGPHRAARAAARRWRRTRSRCSRSARRSSRTARGCCCCSPSRCCRAFSARRTSRRSSYSLLFRWTPERRQLDYLRYVGASDETAKEVQMFGLAPLAHRALPRCSAQRFYDENKTLSIRQGRRQRAALDLRHARLLRRVRRRSSIRAVGGDDHDRHADVPRRVVRARAAISIQRLLLSASDIYEQSLYLGPVRLLRDGADDRVAAECARPVPRPIRTGFVFEDVGFRYPGSERWAVRHVSFALAPGERVALVGENGAGKTTITKLLARLYDPTRRAHPARRRRPPRVRPRVSCATRSA